MSELIERYFGLKAMQTTLRTEIVAGLSTYLSFAYILIINPAILAHTGMDASAILFATAIASGLTTLAMGLWAKLPFAVASGLEMGGFFTFSVCGTLGMTWQQGLGTVFWSGLLCILLTFLPVRQKIIDAIPAGLKINIGVSVGVFVATIGLFLGKLVAFKNGVPDLSGWSLEKLTAPDAEILYVGFLAAIVLNSRRFKFTGSMLVALIIAAVACHLLGVTVKEPPHISSSMFAAIGQFDPFSVISDPRALSVVLVFFILDFFGGIGKFVGLTTATNLQSNGRVKNIEKGLYVDGAGTVLGSFLGTSSLIAFVESAVGIAAGGRTGIVAIVCGVLLLVSLVFTPLVALVPAEAAAGIALYVGWMLLPIEPFQNKNSSFGRFDVGVAILMGGIALMTFGLDKSMLVGFLAYTLRQFVTPKERGNPFLLVTTALLALSVLLQHQWK